MNVNDLVAFVVDILNKVLAALGIDYVIEVGQKEEEAEPVA